MLVLCGVCGWVLTVGFVGGGVFVGLGWGGFVCVYARYVQLVA